MLNPDNLPTIIDGPGTYTTRSGKTVRITEVKTPRIATNNCQGEFKTVSRLGRERSHWNIWSPEGKFLFVGKHPLDIVKKEF